MAAAVADFLPAVAAGGAVVTAALGVWTGLGSSPVSAPFGWHPVLMTLAFPCLLTFGRWAYVFNVDIGLKERRLLHRAFMTLAALAMILGLCAILLSHWSGRMFFGYNFETGEWKPWPRRLHAWLGYLCIVLVWVQGVMGSMKLKRLAEARPKDAPEKKVFSFHGNMGKGIMGMACINILLAISFYAFTLHYKIIFAAMVVVSTGLGIGWPRAEAGDEEQNPCMSCQSSEETGQKYT